MLSQARCHRCQCDVCSPEFCGEAPATDRLAGRRSASESAVGVASAAVARHEATALVKVLVVWTQLSKMRRAVRLTPIRIALFLFFFGMIVRPSTDVSEIRQARATVLSVPSGPLRTASRRGLRPRAKSPSASHIPRMKSTSYKVLLRRSDIFMSSSRRLRGGCAR